MAYPRQPARYQQPASPPEASAQTIDLSFLDQGFYDADGNLREDLLDTHARRWGLEFAPVGETVKKGTQQVSSSQIRRFYGDLKSLQDEMRRSRVNMTSKDERDLAPFKARVKMLKAKASYAAGREKVSAAFHQLMERCVDKIKSPRDFAAFALFFESLLGHYEFFSAQKKEEQERAKKRRED